MTVQEKTNAFRDKISGWSEEKLRKEGVERDVPGAETLDEGTLREAIVGLYRDDLREESRTEPAWPAEAEPAKPEPAKPEPAKPAAAARPAGSR